MGNCVGRYRKKQTETNSYHAGSIVVSSWIEASDFSLYPEEEVEDGEEQHGGNVLDNVTALYVTARDTLPDASIVIAAANATQSSDVDAEGYETANENEGRNDVTKDSGSVYETSDEADMVTADEREQGANSSGNEEQKSMDKTLMNMDASEEEVPNEDDDRPTSYSPVQTEAQEDGRDFMSVLGSHIEEDEDLSKIPPEWASPAQPKGASVPRALDTPFRLNLISPHVRLEALVDKNGRVRRDERVQRYLSKKREQLNAVL